MAAVGELGNLRGGPPGELPFTTCLPRGRRSCPPTACAAPAAAVHRGVPAPTVFRPLVWFTFSQCANHWNGSSTRSRTNHASLCPISPGIGLPKFWEAEGFGPRTSATCACVSYGCAAGCDGPRWLAGLPGRHPPAPVSARGQGLREDGSTSWSLVLWRFLCRMSQHQGRARATTAPSQTGMWSATTWAQRR